MSINPITEALNLSKTPIDETSLTPTVLRLKRPRVASTISVIETRAAKIRRLAAMPEGPFSQLIDDLLREIFVTMDLKFRDISQCYLTCKKWKQIIETRSTGIRMIRKLCNRYSELNLEERIIPKELKDEPCLKMMAKLGMAYSPEIPWLPQYAKWWNRHYVLVIDSSSSMNDLKSDRMSDGTFVNRTEKIWDLAKRVAMNWAEALIPLSHRGLKLVLSEHPSKISYIESKEDFEGPFQASFVLRSSAEMSGALTRIFEQHFAQKTETKRKHPRQPYPTEIVILSDFAFEINFRRLFEQGNGIPISINIINVGNQSAPRFYPEIADLATLTFSHHLAEEPDPMEVDEADAQSSEGSQSSEQSEEDEVDVAQLWDHIQ